ncbi:MAG TPA: ABC transporter substrate-binding protein [Pyrinomonadaceae bacterium]|jgi:branched-chain amino acid transport system substrate-binding protein|nr:ABC transporter substrate-binding protein [Pyrinomonadaceae bacterium]
MTRGATANALLLVAALALFAAAPACRSRARTDNGGDTPRPDDRVRIGAFMSLTGDTAQYGISAHNGMMMAVEEANSAGGVGGRRVELVVQDTRSDAVETEVVVRRLVKDFRVHALLGEVVSSRTLAAARVAQAERVPMLTPSATNPSVTDGRDYVFRSCYTDPHQGAALAHFASHDLGARRAAFLIDAGQDYSSALARFIREEFVRHGGEVVMTVYYGAGAADYTSQLREVGAARPEVIFVPGYYLEAGLMARQLKALGVAAPLVGGDGWDSPRLYEIGGTALVGAYFSSHYSADDTDPRVQNFVADYRRLYNSVPDAFAATAYDAARVMLAALGRAPSLEPAAVRDALAATKDFPGVTGPVTFDENRDAVKPIVVIRIEENGRHAVWRRVEPTEQADLMATPTPSPTPAKRRRRGR